MSCYKQAGIILNLNLPRVHHSGRLEINDILCSLVHVLLWCINIMLFREFRVTMLFFVASHRDQPSGANRSWCIGDWQLDNFSILRLYGEGQWRRRMQMLVSHRQSMASAQLPQPTRSPTPTPLDEIIGAIPPLLSPGTLSIGGLISPLFSPAFDRAFDHLQLIWAILFFKMQKGL